MSDFSITILWCMVQITLISTVGILLSILVKKLGPAIGSTVALASLLTIIPLTFLAFAPLPSWFDTVGRAMPAKGPAAIQETNQSTQTDWNNGTQGNSEAKSKYLVATNSLLDPYAIPSSSVISSSADFRVRNTTDPDALSEASTRESSNDNHSLGIFYFQKVTHALWDGITNRPSINRANNDSLHWSNVGAWVVIVGAIIGIFQLLIGWLLVGAYRRGGRSIGDEEIVGQMNVMREQLGCRSRIQMIETSKINAPATIGFRQPVILLPIDWRNWSDKQRKAVLAHEVAHIARNDFLSILLGQISLSLHFYHPLVHMLVNRLRLQQELAADSAAATAIGNHTDYLSALSEMVLNQSSTGVRWPARAFLPTDRTLLRRIEMLRDTKVFAGGTSVSWRYVTLSLLAIFAIVVVGLRGPLKPTPLIAQAPPVTVFPGTQSSIYDTSYVNGDASFVVALRPSNILNHPAMRTAISQSAKAGEFVDHFIMEYGFDLREVEQMFVSPLMVDSGPQSQIQVLSTVIKMNRPTDFTNTIKLLTKMASVTVIDEVRSGQTVSRIVNMNGTAARSGAVVLGGSVTSDLAIASTILLAGPDNSDLGKADRVVRNVPVNSDLWRDEGILVLQNNSALPWAITLAKTSIEPVGFWRPDDRTLVYDTVANLDSYIDGARHKNNFLSSKLWSEMSTRDLVIVSDRSIFLTRLPLLGFPPRVPKLFSLLAPIVQNANMLGLAISLDRQPSIEIATECSNHTAALEVEAAAEIIRQLSVESLKTISLDEEFSGNPMMVAIGTETLKKLTSALVDAKPIVEGNLTQLKAYSDINLGFVVEPLVAARKAAHHEHSVKNLKQIGMALYDFSSATGHLPASAPQPTGITGERSKFPYSWRVAILPFIGQSDLFLQYHFNEPWDSENNIKLVDQMPTVYRHPSELSSSTHSSYYVFTGPTTIFRNDQPKLEDITDGLRNAILVVEAKRAIPWTKPEDIPFDPEQEIPSIGGFSTGGFNVCLANGAVTFLTGDSERLILKAMIMSQDGMLTPQVR